MKSDLWKSLDEASAARVEAHVRDRLAELERERDSSTWKAERDAWKRLADGDYSERKDGIFAKKNKHLPLTQMVARFLRAKLCKDIFGSRPWFSARPHGPSDATLAEGLQRHLGWKLRECGYESAGRSAIETAIDLGEAFLKETWDRRVVYRTERAVVLVDGPGGAIVAGDDGQPIRIEDPRESAEAPEPGDAPEYVGDDAPAVEIARGVPIWQDSVWEEREIDQREVIHDGLAIDLAPHDDVLFPLGCARLRDADMVAHTITMPASSLIQTLDPDGEDEALRAEILAIVPGAASARSAARTGQNMTAVQDESPQPSNAARSPATAELTVREVYFEIDPRGDGRVSRLFAVWSVDDDRLLDLRYLSDVSPGAEYPIHCVAVNPVPGRVYGRGIYGLYAEHEEIIDRLINSILYRNEYNADPLKVWNPHLTVEGQTDSKLRVEPGRVYTVRSEGIMAKDVLSVAEIPDLDTRTWQLMDLFTQMLQLDSGVTNAAQGEMSSLPSGSTATGINSMLETSSVLHLAMLDDLRPGFESSLRYCAALVYRYQDTDETYEFLEGDASSVAVMSLADAAELRRMRLNVDLLLTRTRRVEMREAGLQALQIHPQFFAMPADVQRMALPLFVSVFKALDIENADRFFPTQQELEERIDAEAQMARAQAQAEGAATGAGGPGMAPAMPSNVADDTAPVPVEGGE